MHDLVIRGGTIVDGTGGAPFIGDVAVDGDRIAAVGEVKAKGRREIDAAGQIVTPGWVDIHTHYDGQATWDQRLQPSSWHGVTTVVMGNCGVGFAPCKPGDHDRLIRLMEGVEDIPFPVLSDGLPWNWESYPDYVESLGGRRFDVDVGSQLPHAALRVYVMGQRGVDREPATEADIAAMSAMTKTAMEAGALGFGTSRTLNHRSSDGSPIATLTADEDELLGIAMGEAAAGKGVLQVVSDFNDPEAEFDMLERIVAKSGRPLSFSLVQSPRDPDQYKYMLQRLSAAKAKGHSMRAQVASRPVGVLFGLELTVNPFSSHPSYRAIKDRPLAERVALLRDPQFRARLLSEEAESARAPGLSPARAWDRIYPMGEEPNYEPTPDQSIAAIAEKTGKDPYAVALDHMLDGGPKSEKGGSGRGMLYLPILNYARNTLDPAYEMLQHECVVPGLSDRGAHVGMICDGSFPTTNLVLWTRDRTRGPKLSIERMVKGQCRDTAETVGLYDRGLVAEGFRADLNVIDYDRLTLKAPSVAYDLPTGGRRLVQRADGYTATIVAGQVTYRDGEPTDALPGRLLRGGRSAPARMAAE